MQHMPEAGATDIESYLVSTNIMDFGDNSAWREVPKIEAPEETLAAPEPLETRKHPFPFLQYPTSSQSCKKYR
jgi:hypothetical protein